MVLSTTSLVQRPRKLDQTAGAAGVKPGEVLTLQVRQTVLAATKTAFAAVLADGSVAAWGEATYGGDGSSAPRLLLRNISKLPQHGDIIR